MRRCIPLLAMPTAESYSKMPVDELAALLEKRVKQIQELREIHEVTHLSAEKQWRLQMFGYEERAMILGEKAGQTSAAQTAWAREELKQIRMEDQAKNRDQTLVFCLCLIFCIWYWYHLAKIYPLRPVETKKVPIGHSHRVMGNPYTWGGWFASNIDTDFEREVKRRTALEKAAALAPKAAPTTAAVPPTQVVTSTPAVAETAEKKA